jgi:hypothetical protein
MEQQIYAIGGTFICKSCQAEFANGAADIISDSELYLALRSMLPFMCAG